MEKYLGRLSGPLLDRIDLHVEVPAVPFEDLSRPADGTGSADMRAQASAARAIQAERFAGAGGGLNGRMSSREVRKFCPMDAETRGMLGTAMADLGLSARAHDRILRVARTIADLAGGGRISPDHLAEAIGYRTLDRKLWNK